MLIGEHPIGSRPGIGESYIVRTKVYDMDQWTVFTGSEPLGGGEIRYHLNRNYGMLLLKQDSIDFDIDYMAAKTANTSYKLSASIKNAMRGILMSITLVPAYELTIPSSSVMNALVWAWAETFDSVWRKMETMANALKLEHATDTYLDDAWGQIFDLPRIYQETDTSYRDRLRTRTTILTSSGTKANCETIIDSIVGEIGATTVTTRYPSTVYINFSSIDAMRVAKEKEDNLNYLIPQMLAAGVSYNLCLPFIDYYMETYLQGPLTLSHTMRYALLHKNTDIVYIMGNANNAQSIFTYDMDSKIMNYHYMNYIIGSLIKSEKLKTYSMFSGLFGTITKSILMTTRNKKHNITKQIIVDQYLQKYNVQKQYQLSALSQSKLRRLYRMSGTITTQPTSPYLLDTIIRLYAISLSMDTCNKRSYPKRYTMAITLVGA